LKREYPELEDDDIGEALEFAARCLDDRIHPLEEARTGELLEALQALVEKLKSRRWDSARRSRISWSSLETMRIVRALLACLLTVTQHRDIHERIIRYRENGRIGAFLRLYSCP
jgi:hypothetical protein